MFKSIRLNWIYLNIHFWKIVQTRLVYKTLFTIRILKFGILSKSIRVQNPPDFFIFLFLLLNFINLLHFIAFCLFFTITVTPNHYPRSVSGSINWLGGFWSGGFWLRVEFERVPYIQILKYPSRYLPRKTCLFKVKSKVIP